MSNFTRYDAALSMQYHKQASELLGRDHWIVTEPFVYYLDSLDSNLYVTVPTGFLTDGASVPRILWSVVPPWGGYGQSAVLHDYLCEFALITNGHIRLPIDRKRCDEIFIQSLDVLGVSKYKQCLLSSGVSIYRNAMRPPSPNVNILKCEIEHVISVNYARIGTFQLTESQYNALKTQTK